MPRFRIERNSFVLVTATLALILLAWEAPGGASESGASERRISEWRMAEAEARKDATKATQPPKAAGAKPSADACDPATRNLDGISAVLNQGAQQIQKTCATAASPARIKLVGANSRAIVVRPITGDVDALLTRNGEIIDVSMNTKRRVELLLLPAAGELELVVSAESATATFEISAVQLARLVAKKPQSERTAPAQQKGTPQADPAAKVDTPEPLWVSSGVFRDLGFDVIDPASPADNFAVDPRAIMAFQAGEKFEITGILKPEQITVLGNQAAALIDVVAQDAVRTSRRISGNSPLVTFADPAADQAAVAPPSPTKDQAGKKGAMEQDDQPDAPPPGPPPGLKSMKGVFQDGRFFGAGLLRSGGQFEGEWLDGPTAGDSQRPALGMLFMANDCSATIKTFGMPAVGDEGSAIDETTILGHSIGVLRQKSKTIFSGDLARAGQQLQSCGLNPSQ